MFPTSRFRCHLLPSSLLLLLLHVPCTISQFTLELNTPFEFDPATQSSSLRPVTFTIPPSTSALTVSFSLCSAPPSDGSWPRIFASNNSAVMTPGEGDVNGVDVREVVIAANGTGWTEFGETGDGGVVVVDLGGGEEMPFELAISDSGPLHTSLFLPFFGDSTQNQALLFSPPLPLPITADPSPTYPNYTLPPANLSFPSAPPQDTVDALDVTLLLASTPLLPEFDVNTNTFVDGLPVSACALRRVTDMRTVGSEGAGVGTGAGEARLMLRDEDGWRMQWLVEGLEPQTNYTAFVVQEGTKVGGPIQFVTKSAAFSCTLLHSLPFCPRIAYTIPLTAPAGSNTFDGTNLDPSITAPIIEYMTNFTTSLLTFACGRDWYSPVQSCESCQKAYRNWLCSVSFPRCGEFSQTQSQTQSQVDPALINQSPQSPLERRQLARNPALASLSTFSSTTWTALLPCLETCNAADRACPDFLGFRCPIPRFTASESYGVGYVDGDGSGGVDGGTGGWIQSGGAVGVSQDRWGNVWCNGS